MNRIKDNNDISCILEYNMIAKYVVKIMGSVKCNGQWNIKPHPNHPKWPSPHPTPNYLHTTPPQITITPPHPKSPSSHPSPNHLHPTPPQITFRVMGEYIYRVIKIHQHYRKVPFYGVSKESLIQNTVTCSRSFIAISSPMWISHNPIPGNGVMNIQIVSSPPLLFQWYTTLCTL